MIRLTRRNGGEMYLNADLVATVEPAATSTSDGGRGSMITLVDAQVLHVREPVDEVVSRVTRYRAALLTLTEQMAAHPSAAPPTPAPRGPVADEGNSGRPLYVLRGDASD